MTTEIAPWPTRLPLVAILRGIEPAEVLAHMRELVAAGFDAIEIPLNSPGWERSLPDGVREFGAQTLVGAGTVLTPEKVDRVADLGGRLIVTPHTDTAVIQRSRERGLYTSIGFATPTEAFAALQAGAQSLKLFPSTAFGPAYVKAIRAVLPRGLPLLAVGGVTPENLGAFLEAGCQGAGLGSDLYKPGQAPELTRQRAEAFVQAYRQHHA
ncbi:2-dehydro-3-deoxy-6-phosphogalactonate aldolase [Dyella sp.]|uniref:2-dehydro-3-deoxy-6-phosphogalactonate aldolase n=1 Tax=Dyella sp. TaxID=1869338 RepID=UPI002ED046BC